MKRESWLQTILPGMKDEFERRYANAWPELKSAWAAMGSRHGARAWQRASVRMIPRGWPVSPAS